MLAVPAASFALKSQLKDLLRYTVGSVFQEIGKNDFSAMYNYNPQALKIQK